MKSTAAPPPPERMLEVGGGGVKRFRRGQITPPTLFARHQRRPNRIRHALSLLRNKNFSKIHRPTGAPAAPRANGALTCPRKPIQCPPFSTRHFLKKIENETRCLAHRPPQLAPFTPNESIPPVARAPKPDRNNPLEGNSPHRFWNGDWRSTTSAGWMTRSAPKRSHSNRPPVSMATAFPRRKSSNCNPE